VSLSEPGLVRLAGAFAIGFLHCAGKVPIAPEPQPAVVATATADPVATSAPVAPAPVAPPLAPNASYDEALAIPEALDVQDERAHLTDSQLMNPVRNVPGDCRVPSRAKVTVKIAVREGRAIGVTVLVTFEGSAPVAAAGKPARKKKNAVKNDAAAAKAAKARAKAEAETRNKTIECFDTAVRALTWPANARRDSFTTVY
jgi:hypothetical protein